MMKPVWRVNTGNGVPSDLGDRYRFRCGQVNAVNYMAMEASVWKILNDSTDVVAYQTNRTRKAKYRKCSMCSGGKKLSRITLDRGRIHYTCGLCNSAGMERVQ